MCLKCFENGNFKNGLFVGPGNIFDKSVNPDFTIEELEDLSVKIPEAIFTIVYLDDNKTMNEIYKMDFEKANAYKHDKIQIINQNIVRHIKNTSHKYDYIFFKKVIHGIDSLCFEDIIDYASKNNTRIDIIATSENFGKASDNRYTLNEFLKIIRIIDNKCSKFHIHYSKND